MSAVTLSSRLKAEVCERDNYNCQRCNYPVHADNIDEQLRIQNLDVHHVIPSHDGGTDDLENLVALCQSCHEWAHYYEETGTWDGIYRDPRRARWMIDPAIVPLDRVPASYLDARPDSKFDIRDVADRLPDVFEHEYDVGHYSDELAGL